ncbi:MAB_1171c family putative transporter [Streptomyces sp. NPDC017520]|uniref:MAB_1171c family putative transporter n=1 Tax=Streptomyces sp. NPDC017520 TaxID=3364998 RepID=UPI0037B7A10E
MAETMNSLLYPLCSTIALLILLYKLQSLRADRSVTQVVLAANSFFLFITFTVSTPSIWVLTSDFVGIVNFSGLLTQGSIIIMTACQQLLLLHLSYDPDIARVKAVPRLISLAVAIVAMSVLFAGAAEQGEAPNDFAIAHAQYTPAYLFVYLVAFTVNQVEIGVMGWRYSKIAPSLWLRRGLRLVSFALPFVLAYTTCRAAEIVVAQFGESGNLWEPAAQLAVATAVLVQTLGWILPDLGPHLTSAVIRLRHRRVYRVLAPLHRHITEQVPEIVIQVDLSWDLRTRLYRMVIEIRDAQWALHSWMDSRTAVVAHEEAERDGVEGEELAALVEAAQISGAIERKRHNHLPEEISETPLSAAPGDLAAELVFQQKLARAMSSPVALRAARHASASGTSPAREGPG